MQSPQTSLAARGLSGLELQHIARFVFFFSLALLCTEEETIWQRAAWFERDLDTMRRARSSILIEDESERKTVFTLMWEERTRPNHPNIGQCTAEELAYHSARSQIERFRRGGGWELFSTFEFDFRRCDFFLNDSIFLVCSKFNHKQRDCTCACAVACLHPQNSISNVLVSLTIHDNMKILLRDVAKNLKPLWKVEGLFNRTSWKVSDV